MVYNNYKFAENLSEGTMRNHLFTSEYFYFSFAGLFASKVYCGFAEKVLA